MRLIIIFLLILTGCANNSSESPKKAPCADSKLLGQWEYETVLVVFDSQCNYSGTEDGTTYKGQYKDLNIGSESGKVELTMRLTESQNITVIFDYSFVNNKPTLTNGVLK